MFHDYTSAILCCVFLVYFSSVVGWFSGKSTARSISKIYEEELKEAFRK